MRTATVVLFITWSVTAATVGAAPLRAQSEDYHILLTNDDGIESPGIQALAAALTDVGQVTMVAPCGERSGSSMSVALRGDFRLQTITRDGRTLGQCVDMTPAGAIMLGIEALAPEGGFDLVVSGINRGANVGEVSHMSGTVGGAMMGAFYGVPAVAASLGGTVMDFDYSARFVAEFVAELRRHPPMPGIVLSINIPHAAEADVAGVAYTPMGGSFIQVGFEALPDDGEGRVFRSALQLARTGFPAGSDTEAYMQNMITVTPLRFDWTAHDVLDQLEGWNVSHRTNR